MLNRAKSFGFIFILRIQTFTKARFNFDNFCFSHFGLLFLVVAARLEPSTTRL